MKIISWNLWDANQQLEKSIKLVLKENPDVACFQEFRKESRYLLKNYSNYDFFFAKDFRVIRKTKPDINCNLIIAIKKKYKAKFRKIKMPSFNSKPLLKRLTGWEESLEFCYVDFNYKRKKMRLFNCHLSCAANPKRRLIEIKEIMNRTSEIRENIICGDFNNFANPWFNFLIGWLFGFRPKDYIKNEKKTFKRIYLEKKLKNIFRTKITYPLFSLQLDHIIIPSDYTSTKMVTHKRTIKYSDHFMISANVIPKRRIKPTALKTQNPQK